VSTVLCGLIPALESGNLPIARILQEGVISIVYGRRRMRSVLVAFEMTSALVFLLGTGVMVSSLLRVERIDTGLKPDGVLTFIAGLPDTRYPKPWQQLKFFRDSLSTFNQLPGVQGLRECFRCRSAAMIGKRPLRLSAGPSPSRGGNRPHGWRPSADLIFLRLAFIACAAVISRTAMRRVHRVSLSWTAASRIATTSRSMTRSI
jgi:hypothetical protein